MRYVLTIILDALCSDNQSKAGSPGSTYHYYYDEVIQADKVLLACSCTLQRRHQYITFTGTLQFDLGGLSGGEWAGGK